MTTSAAVPFLWLPDLTGVGLEGGYVYFGVANLDPVGNPIAIFSDAACVIALSQPVRTSGGFVVDGSGSPVNVYVAGTSDFSVAVQDAYNQPLYAIASYPVRFVSSSITFDTIVVGTSVVPDTAGGAFVGSVTLPMSVVVSRAMQARSLQVYSQTQPAVTGDLNKITQRALPLLAVNQNSITGAATWFNGLNVDTALSSGGGGTPGVYTVVPTVALPSTDVIVIANIRDQTGGTGRRGIQADVVSTTSIAVRTFVPSTEVATDCKWSLMVFGNPAIADPIL